MVARPAIAALAAATWVSGIPLAAQGSGPPAISVGKMSSAEQCSVYQQSAGRSGMVATPYAVAAYSSWRTWLVKDCISNFATLRTSIEAALAASGGVRVRAGGGYVVSGVLSEVSGGPGSEGPRAPDMGPDGFSVATNGMRVNMDVTVRDARGNIVFGTLLTKTIETGSDIRVGDFRTRSNESGDALYTRLQHEVALAVARKIAFHFTPLRVIGGGGRQIQLNYGEPLLRLGTIVQATSADGGTTVRYSVVSASDGTATARADGGGDATRIVPGSSAVTIENDDPAANGRRFEKVDLP